MQPSTFLGLKSIFWFFGMFLQALLRPVDLLGLIGFLPRQMRCQWGGSGILIGKTLRVYSISAVYRHTWSISGTVCLYYKWYIYICIIRIYSRVLEFCLIPWSIWPYSEHGEPWLGWRHRNGFEWLTPDVDMTNPRQNPQFVMPSLWYLCF